MVASVLGRHSGTGQTQPDSSGGQAGIRKPQLPTLLSHQGNLQDRPRPEALYEDTRCKKDLAGKRPEYCGGGVSRAKSLSKHNSDTMRRRSHLDRRSKRLEQGAFDASHAGLATHLRSNGEITGPQGAGRGRMHVEAKHGQGLAGTFRRAIWDRSRYVPVTSTCQ